MVQKNIPADSREARELIRKAQEENSTVLIGDDGLHLGGDIYKVTGKQEEESHLK